MTTLRNRKPPSAVVDRTQKAEGLLSEAFTLFTLALPVGLANQRVGNDYKWTGETTSISLPMQPAAHLLESVLSKPRLDSYRSYWRVNADGAVGLYMWNGEVCAELSKLLHFFEVALRNSAHRALSLNQSAGASNSVAWWDALWPQLSVDTQSKIQALRVRARPSPDELVSRLSFGFWPNLLNWMAKQRTGLMPAVLPGHALSLPGAQLGWHDRRCRAEALQPFFELKDLRNRIAHHEPVWKFGPLLDTSSGAARRIAAASTNEATTLQRFARLMSVFDQATQSVSAGLQAALASASCRTRLNMLLSANGVDRYRCGRHVMQPPAMDVQEFSHAFGSIIRRDRPVQLKDPQGAGLFIPG